MGRPLRIEFSGACYHVFNQAPTGQSIVSTDAQRQHFVELIAETSRMFGLTTHAWSLLDNEYHLLVTTQEANLGRAMRHLGGVFTQLMNREYSHDGALFKGRYRAILLEPTEYLAPVSRYIHNRAVELGQAKKPETYAWSSAKAYLKGDAMDWLDTADVLSHLTVQPGQNRQAAYKAYLAEPAEPELIKFYASKRKKPVLASKNFLNTIGGARPQRYSPREDSDNRRPDLSNILAAVASAFEVDRDILDMSGRKGSPNIPRLAGLYIARNRAGHSYKDIAGQFAITNSASVGGLVSQATKSVESDPELEAAVNELCAKLNL